MERGGWRKMEGWTQKCGDAAWAGVGRKNVEPRYGRAWGVKTWSRAWAGEERKKMEGPDRRRTLPVNFYRYG